MTRSASTISFGSSSHFRGWPAASSFDRSQARSKLRFTSAILSHLSRADHDDLFVVESLEKLARKVGDRHARNTDPLLIDRGFRCDSLGHPQRRLEGRVGQGADTARGRGQFVCLFHLAEDLRLADDHAVEAGGHREQVTDKVLAGPLEQVVEQVNRLQTMEIGQEADDVVMRWAAFRLFRRDVQLHPIARRKEHRLCARKSLPQAHEGLDRLVLREGQSLANLYARRVMAAADHLQFHQEGSLYWKETPEPSS
jgi:hypothetical protein